MAVQRTGRRRAGGFTCALAAALLLLAAIDAAASPKDKEKPKGSRWRCVWLPICRRSAAKAECSGPAKQRMALRYAASTAFQPTCVSLPLKSTQQAAALGITSTRLSAVQTGACSSADSCSGLVHSKLCRASVLLPNLDSHPHAAAHTHAHMLPHPTLPPPTTATEGGGQGPSSVGRR